MMRNFDSYDAVKRLSRVGIPEEQASEIIQAIMNSREYDLSKLATKEQVAALEHSIGNRIADLEYSTNERTSELDRSISEKLSKLENMTKEQFARVGQEIALIKKDIEAIKNQMATTADIQQAKFDILKWILPFLIGIIIAIFFKK